MDKLRDDWEERKLLSSDALIARVTAKFNNLVHAKKLTLFKPNNKGAYTTSTNSSVNPGNSSNNTQNNTNLNLGPEEWQKKKVNGKNSITRNGKTWHWCPHHCSKFYNYDGLYITYKPEEHNDWKKRKDEENRTEIYKRNVNFTEEKPKMIMSEKLKKALISQGNGWTDDMANNFIKDLHLKE